MAVETEKKIHMIGIGGAGMSGIARILKEMGKEITGSDLQANEITNHLKKMGITVFSGHSPTNLKRGTDLVVFSSAIPMSNPEVKKAFQMGIPVLKRGDMLACLLNTCESIAVAGAHGKTTTTSMIATMLEENGLNPSFIIGGELQDSNLGAKLGDGKYFVAEADESDASFLKLAPYAAVVTNVENDHLDFYHSVERIRDAFSQFIGQVRTGGFAVLYHDDPFLAGLRNTSRHLIFYGSSPKADYYFTDLRSKGWGSSFKVWHNASLLGSIELVIPGRHNVANALATVAVGTELGIPFPGISMALSRFKGAKRRFQLIGQVQGITIFDDYAHHPTEIEATINAVRQFHEGRLIVVFQPHRYSRTRLLGEQFGGAFRNADLLITTDIYSAGEEPIPGVTGDIIYQAAQRSGCQVLYLANPDLIIDYLHEEALLGDIIIFMGAGDIWKTGERLKGILEDSNPPA